MTVEPRPELPFKTKVALWFLGFVALAQVLTIGSFVYRALAAGRDLGAAAPTLLLHGVVAAGLVSGFLGLLRRTDWGRWSSVLVLGLLSAFGALVAVYVAANFRNDAFWGPRFMLLFGAQALGLLALCGTPFFLLIVDRKAYAVAVRNRWRRK